METMPCPLCGASTNVLTLEGHMHRKHPEACVHVLEHQVCPHLAFHGFLMHGPRREGLPDFAVPMRVN